MSVNYIKKICSENGFKPNKRLGQNFLADDNVRDKILNAYSIACDETVMEIGPGLGAMTSSIASRCKKVIAIEKDPKVCAIMKPVFDAAGNVFLFQDDFLKVDISKHADGGKVKICGNVPYYITTPIIEKILEQRGSVTSAFLVVQDELAVRIAAPPGTRACGSISCFIQYFAAVKKVFKIKKGCFYPKPQVESCLLRLDILDEPRVKVKDEELFFRIIRRAFSERRKMMLNPLSSGDIKGLSKSEWTSILTELEISTSSRAEDLSLEEFARISNKLS